MDMKLDILAIGAHPDDVELGCGATIYKEITLGKRVGILDLTQGELGTRGTAEIRAKESAKAAQILGVFIRENMDFADGFFINDKAHQMALIEKIRLYRPEIVICNAVEDRHIDCAHVSNTYLRKCWVPDQFHFLEILDNGITFIEHLGNGQTKKLLPTILQKEIQKSITDEMPGFGEI